MKNEKLTSSRRRFLQQTALAGAGILFINPAIGFSRNSDASHDAEIMPADGQNVPEIENSAMYCTTVYAWLRTDIPLEVGHNYWRDIHGTLVSRIPGTWLYRQLHWKPAISVLSSRFQRFVKPLSDADQPQGIAHTFYYDEAGRRKFENHPFIKKYLLDDEPMLVRLNATLWSKDDNSGTLKDTSNNMTPQGKPENDEYAVSFILDPELSAGKRKQSLINLAGSLAKLEKTTRVRYHLLEDYDDDHFPDTKVPHHRPVAVRYNAWIELGVAPQTDLATILEPGLSNMMNELDTIHIYPIYDKYTIMAGGKPTIVGLKGYPAYQTILAAGAKNQLQQQMLDDVYGKVPLG
ncbi:twin-arginine translocation signal domain-containing protein [Mucilaginibacter sp. 22184]|uniref:twin-arginine translocation signal domain-containing protein n=1 Tax=Mucilaginibacter sp. 22184 TaxID=3453887 RepID=UPI003F845AD6